MRGIDEVLELLYGRKRPEISKYFIPTKPYILIETDSSGENVGKVASAQEWSESTSRLEKTFFGKARNTKLGHLKGLERQEEQRSHITLPSHRERRQAVSHLSDGLDKIGRNLPRIRIEGSALNSSS